MAKRYRYAFAQKKPAKKGIFAVALAGVSVGLFLVVLLSAYGFVQGVKSFSEENKSHTVSIISAMANGVITVGWLALFLMGV